MNTGAVMFGVLVPPLLILPFVTSVPHHSSPPTETCRRCCDSLGPAERPPGHTPEIRTIINMTILKGDKGDRGDKGTPGKSGQEGSTGWRGPEGPKGAKGNAGPPGDPCKTHHAAFSVGRRKALHSEENYQVLVFDTVFVNLDKHFDMFSGKFRCHVPGVYFFNVNVHTWNFKETYLHVMQNEQERAIVYAQPSDRSIMQSQSLMLPLDLGDDVWLRLYKHERENAIYSDDVDIYITFNGYLIKPE
ncbi:complement C1q tumor necrosis factor-related protein 1 isoform X2 [Denticeps clupeoides]|uniref:C1q and TNF related 6a n=1 Tax=Denticeps clupeoides TaxID=299321 RepID=A0AAY4ARV2_9TELE|nr:complement C1q tumor necrosis factor-related protein 1-like isoform X2 [Denticeps clupeoides]